MRANRDFGRGTRTDPSTSLPRAWSMPNRIFDLDRVDASGSGPVLASVIHRKWGYRHLLQADERFLKKPLGKSRKHLY
ncbi:hypothetical protein [Rhizobium sp. HT1-10]|uniref:hypothetical protein n=1 Tax=Rhizobium sp. HT1-10 TaxID=3111638 RepID=UPI003C2975AC